MSKRKREPHNQSVTFGCDGRRHKYWLCYVKSANMSKTGTKHNDADSDNPGEKEKKIRIRQVLKQYPRSLLDALIHESIHASVFPIDEALVSNVACDMACKLIRKHKVKQCSEASKPISSSLLVEMFKERAFPLRDDSLAIMSDDISRLLNSQGFGIAK